MALTWAAVEKPGLKMRWVISASESGKWSVRTSLPFTAVRFFFGEMRVAIPNIIRLLWNKKEQLKVLRGESIC
jgi:hypothetical protein